MPERTIMGAELPGMATGEAAADAQAHRLHLQRLQLHAHDVVRHRPRAPRLQQRGLQCNGRPLAILFEVMQSGCHSRTACLLGPSLWRMVCTQREAGVRCTCCMPIGGEAKPARARPCPAAAALAPEASAPGAGGDCPAAAMTSGIAPGAALAVTAAPCPTPGIPGKPHALAAAAAAAWTGRRHA